MRRFCLWVGSWFIDSSPSLKVMAAIGAMLRKDITEAIDYSIKLHAQPGGQIVDAVNGLSAVIREQNKLITDLAAEISELRARFTASAVIREVKRGQRPAKRRPAGKTAKKKVQRKAAKSRPKKGASFVA
jgi:hypothetical protein